MSEIKHTPGPWLIEREIDVADDDGDYEVLTFVRKIGPFHIEWHDDLNKNSADRIEADIALSSAATDLLEALRLCYDHCRLYHREVETNNVGKAVRAAIAKATGAAQ